MLHILYQSPFESQSWRNCLAVCAPKDMILLIENGVFCALSGSISGNELMNFIKHKSIFVLTQHAEERGVLSRLIDDVRSIDFENFVDLVVENYPVLRW